VVPSTAFTRPMPAPGSRSFLEQAGPLLDLVSIDGLRAWVEYGVRNYAHHPDQQRAYFNCESADSRAVLAARAPWLPAGEPHPVAGPVPARVVAGQRPAGALTRPVLTICVNLFPTLTPMGIRLPDVYDDWHGIARLDRYRAALAHMAAQGAGASAIVADNFSPFQRLALNLWRTHGWRRWRCAAIPDCVASPVHCTLSRRKALATQTPIAACATAWPCCHAPCSCPPRLR
jgi:nitric oxide reductase NorD protein